MPHSIDHLFRATLLSVFVPLALSCLQPIHADTGFEKQTVLARGEDAGAWAIPKLVRTPKGNALIVLQDRQGGDWGKPILPVALRSVDAGQHWSVPRPLLPTDFPRQDDCIFKPTGIVVDDEQGKIFVFISRAPLRKPDGSPLVERDFYRNIQATRAQGRAWFVIESTDDGITWSPPYGTRNTVVRSESQIMSRLSGDATFNGISLNLTGSMVLGSTHFLISECPSANESPAAPLW